MKRWSIIEIIATFILPTLVFWGAMLCLTSAAMASPLTLSYHAYAYATNPQSGVEDLSETAYGLPFPVSASAEVDNAYAIANCLDGRELYAEAWTYDNGTAEASVTAYTNFTANFPQISIKFDYEIWTYADSPYSTHRAVAGLWGLLIDIDLGSSFLWEFNPKQITDVTSSPVPISGTINMGKDLIPGHYYQFGLVLGRSYGESDLPFWETTSVIYAESPWLGEARAYARVSNLKVEATPCPAALLLLGTGLFGLAGLGLRRKRG